MKPRWPVPHDAALARIYAGATRETTEQISFDLPELERLTDLLNDECRSSYDRVAVGKRLVTLRKKGELVRKYR